MSIDRPAATRTNRLLLTLLMYCVGGMALAQTAFKPVSVLDAKTIQGRTIALDARGKLLPWPMPEHIGASYETYALTQWSFLLQQYQGPRYYYFHCCVDFDRKTFVTIPDRNWANSTAYLRAMLEGLVERLYPYTGDPQTIRLLQDLVDYEFQHGTTPANYAWSGVPYPSADPGVADYRGWSRHAVDFIEPPIVGEDGYAYLRLYEMTGVQRYLQAAIRCADALAKHVRSGDAIHSPWPVRVFARSGEVGPKNMGEYSANVIEPIALFDEMIRLRLGKTASYRRAREIAWQWLLDYPMKTNVWVGYFEDVAPDLRNMNNVIPLETARYLLLHPDTDAHWKTHAAQLIDWVRTTPKWPKYIVHGATVTTEQGDGHAFCCGKPNDCCDSHTARLAAVEAIYYWRTEDDDYREQAFRSYNWVTYQQGFPPLGNSPWGQNQWWFTDEFADGPRRMMDAFWAVPSWAPEDAAHFLGSESVVTHIAYGKDSIAYSTFDDSGDDVLRLDFVPTRLSADGHPLEHAQGSESSYAFDAATHVLRIHRVHARHIEIHGEGGHAPASKIDFDHPQLAAGTVLRGEYPRDGIDWGHGAWKIGVPEGRMATFNLRVVDGNATQVALSPIKGSVLVGLTVFNRGTKPVTFRMHAGSNSEAISIIPPDTLRRIRTPWTVPASTVSLSVNGGQHMGDLLFDDVEYRSHLDATTATELVH
jgi:hypothetical protein